APRVVEAILSGRDGPDATGAMRAVLGGAPDDAVIGGRPLSLPPLRVAAGEGDPGKQRDQLQAAMTTGAGVLRSGTSLAATAATIAALADEGSGDAEVHNLLTLAWALVHAADARRGSRGA